MSFALERWGDKAIVVNMRTGHHMTKDPISLQRAEPNLKRANNMEKKKGKAQSDTEFIEKMAKEHFTVEPEAPKSQEKKYLYKGNMKYFTYDELMKYKEELRETNDRYGWEDKDLYKAYYDVWDLTEDIYSGRYNPDPVVRRLLEKSSHD